MEIIRKPGSFRAKVKEAVNGATTWRRATETLYPLGGRMYYYIFDEKDPYSAYMAVMEIGGEYWEVGQMCALQAERNEPTYEDIIEGMNRSIDNQREQRPCALNLVEILMPERLEDAKAADAAYHARIEANRKADAEKKRMEEEKRRKEQEEEQRRFDEVVNTGLVRSDLKKMQRGMVLAALEERYASWTDDGYKVGTLYEFITKYGFTEMRRNTYTNGSGKPIRKYYIRIPGTARSFSVSGRFGMLCNISPENEHTY